MDMSFFASSKGQILFKGWTVSTAGGMVGSCIAVIFVAILFETLKSYKVLHRKPCEKNSESTPLIRRQHEHQPRFEMTNHLKTTLLFMLQFLIGYFLMLVAMTYNIWLFLAVVLGSGIGYFLVNPCIENYFSQHKQSRSHLSENYDKGFVDTVNL